MYIWNIPSGSFSYREGFQVSKEHILHSDLSSSITNGEVTVKKTAQPSGRKWVSYFVYYIHYSYVQGHDESRALLCKSHWTALSKQHRVRAGVSSEELTAKQTGQKPLQTPSTQRGWEHSCPREHLLRGTGTALLFSYCQELIWVRWRHELLVGKNEQSGKPKQQDNEERKEEKAGAAEGTELHKVLQGSTCTLDWR